MPERRALLGVIGFSVALGTLLTAPQWIPSFHAAAESYRASGLSYSEATERSLNPTRLLELFTPYLFGTRENWFGHALVGADAVKPLPWSSSVQWYTLVSIALKSPPLWLLGVCLGLVGLVRRRRPLLSYAPFVPLAIYAVLLLFVNRMSIGVRHALPLVAFGAVLGAVWFARLSSPVLRRYAALAWVLGALVSALSSFPHYISYFPSWAGGVSGGHRWMVDSSYDWGQDLEKLEVQWASVTDAIGGTPPHLMYFGFLDPEHMYGMGVAGPSLKGFMGRAWVLSHGQDVYHKWVSSFSTVKTPTVCSVSALHLDPYGIDMRAMRSGQDLGRIGHTLRLILPGN